MNVKLIGAYAVYSASVQTNVHRMGPNLLSQAALFDLLILVVSLIGLKRIQGNSLFTHSLRAQGISYFAAMLIVHCPIAVSFISY